MTLDPDGAAADTACMRITGTQREVEDNRGLTRLDVHTARVTAVPRGRDSGLWCALAVVAAPSLQDRALPVTDTSRFGSTETMFDYDTDLAIDLDVALGEVDIAVY